MCPSDILPKENDHLVGKANYCANVGSDDVWNIAPSWGNPSRTTQTGIMVLAQNNNNTHVIDMANVSDGTSNTLAVGEATVSENVTPSKVNSGFYPVWVATRGGQWRIGNWGRIAGPLAYINRPGNGQPEPNDWSDFAFGSQHPGGANFGLVDGSVRFLAETIDTVMYTRLAARNDGLPVTLE